LTDLEKLDAVDLIIAVLRDHEKTFDRLLEKLEKFTDRTVVEGLSYGQSLKTVRAQAYTLQSLTDEAVTKREAMERFIHALNRWELIPNDWIPDLIIVGTNILQEATELKEPMRIE